MSKKIWSKLDCIKPSPEMTGCLMLDFLKSRFMSSSTKNPLMMDLRKILLISDMFNYKIMQYYLIFLNERFCQTIKESRSSEMSVVGLPFFEIFCFAAGFSR